MKLSKFMLMTNIILIIMWGISSSSWFSIWMALEMNNMMVIPLMLIKTSQQFIEATLKYFLIQAISSTTFIMMSFSITLPLFFNLKFSIPTQIMIMSMMMKIGMFPFLLWYPDVISKSNFIGMKLIMTIQKLLPLMIISILLTNYNKINLIFLGINALLGSIIALNQTNMKKILAFSSINQMSWMMLSVILSYSIFFMYFLIYSSLILIIISYMKHYSIKLITQMFLMKNIYMSMNILSLAGLPPFSGFIIKWMILEMMIKTQMILLSMIMILSSVISLYFYIRLMISSMMLTSITMKWMPKIKSNTNYFNMMILINLLSIPVLLVLYSLN